MKFSELNENDLKVIRGIHNVVKERGADWRYPNGYVDGNPAYAENPIDAKVCAGADGGCVNLREDGTGSCIIGSVAVDQKLDTVRVSSAGQDADRWEVSNGVRDAMIGAQSKQDTGFAWGTALARFNTVLAQRIEDYDAELLNFLAK